MALSETAWGHQIEALRNAICKHITLQMSLRVHISSRGFMEFCLELHLAYLILREPETGPDATTDQTLGDRESFERLSFLMDDPSADTATVPKIYQAHISVVICGWTNTQWTGYAFANTGLEPESFEEYGEDEPKHDLFAADRSEDYVKDTDPPTWDARKYWLEIVGIRCQLVLREWQYLVNTVEDKVEHRRLNDPCSCGSNHTIQDPQQVQRSLNWTLQTMQLLRKLSDTLSVTLRAYTRFDARDGDKCYFSDIKDPSIRILQNGIKESFEKLADLHSRLLSLDDSCNRFATHLGRLLSLESNRLTAQSNLLNHESNLLNAQSRDIQERTQELSQATITLNKEIRKLNEESTEAARANQNAAAKTSLSTRVNVEV
ncbi:hypothetical protein EK21DRAFT_107892 [Setomelanomma holmii]|uniref:Uncharacterized protein n=1 Tax=Setomelanomma holmii TaxID=210430 RepID=A0A9P4HGV5_9PLEO|nr:hypothetical protein EK21DRAFT_107892 [Setomelanomma holmii]